MISITTSRGLAARTMLAAGLLSLAAGVNAQTAPSTARPAAPAPAQRAAPTAPQQAQPGFASVQQVCQMREREIALVNTQLLQRNQAIARETDAARRAQLAAPINQLRANLRETEVSWQRMDCVRVLYGR